ncbi:MAG: ABC transporter ATP-binding protein [Bifidobacteriaceae bacterium]|jgi:spermidine/putrescine transport system ATP-binding protein|nr:ABC transporter ATP-binding protein [Bifidobacteriaceae bacterium]
MTTVLSARGSQGDEARASAARAQQAEGPSLEENRPEGLRLTGLRKTFDSAEGGLVQALDGVSLDILAGEFFVLLGPSGCGKTTLLRAVAGLEPLDSGEIYLGDRRIDVLPPAKRPVNTVFQSYALFPHLSVAENIAFGLRMGKWPKPKIATRVAEMLDLVQLPGIGARKPSQLSGGQQQRVALARALAKEPRVLLLDEPLSALDLKLRRGMQAELGRIQRETGITFIFVTHDQEEALTMGNRIAVFQNGQAVQVGTPEEIYDHPVNRFVADFIGDTNFVASDILQRDGALTARLGDHTFALTPGAGAAVAGQAATLAIRPENITLTAAESAPLAGRLMEVTYMGTDLRCRVELSGGVTLRARVAPPFPTAHLTVGGSVGVKIDPGDVKVVAD